VDQPSKPANGPEAPGGTPDLPVDVVKAEKLFRGKREVQIEHEGVVYRLRITRRNKLILQK
jgi:hemin uptake protein HemP